MDIFSILEVTSTHKKNQQLFKYFLWHRKYVAAHISRYLYTLILHVCYD